MQRVCLRPARWLWRRTARCSSAASASFPETRRSATSTRSATPTRDGRADEVKTILTGLNMPNGVAFRDGALFVGEQHRIVRYDNIVSRLDNPPAPVVVADLPTDPSTTNHSWKYLRFGPDGKLYVPVGGPCNVCDRGDPWATILRMNPDGSDGRCTPGVSGTQWAWHSTRSAAPSGSPTTAATCSGTTCRATR